jgi:exonuclease VII small subunit
MDRQSSYARTRERLEEIDTQVKARDMSLERSLDLYEEALRLGNVCAEMIDRTDFSAEELEDARSVDEAVADDEAAMGDDVTGDGSDEPDEVDETVAAAATEDDEADEDDENDEAIVIEEQA